MFARLRPLLLLPTLVAAVDRGLFTSSVTYCEPPETLLVQQFDIKYTTANQSITFDISAASVQANVSVSANVLVMVYGIKLLNTTIDLCSILAGALCPLPMYNFVGSDSISLPENLGVVNKIPSIAFGIPDLEAYAQLKLVEVGTGNIKACVQATLSNGWSTHQESVSWATAALAFFALLVGAWQSARTVYGVVPYRFVELLHLYQTIATTALLSINFPTLYRAYGLNFAWAMGLISSPHSKLQTSIDNMRALTGGSLANSSSGSAVGFVDRKLSPWNTALTQPSTGFSTSLAQSFFATGPLESNFSLSQISLSQVRQPPVSTAVVNEVQTVTDSSANVLKAGLPIYVNSIHIGTANTFMTTFLVTLVIIAIFIAVAGILFGVVVAARWSRWGGKSLRMWYIPYVRSWALRVALVLIAPISLFALYQWSLKDSWLSILLSVLTFLGIWAFVLHAAFRTLRLARRETSEALESDQAHLDSHASLYAQYRTARYYFFLLFLGSTLVKAIVLSAAQDNGLAQVVLFLIVELAVLVANIVLKPYRTRGGDVFSTFLAVVRVVCTGLMLAFVESINVAAIPRVAIGAVALVIFSVAVLIVAVNIFLHSGISWLWRHRNARSRMALSSSSSLDAEKAQMESPNRIDSESASVQGSVPRSEAGLMQSDHR